MSSEPHPELDNTMENTALQKQTFDFQFYNGVHDT